MYYLVATVGYSSDLLKTTNISFSSFSVKEGKPSILLLYKKS